MSQTENTITGAAAEFAAGLRHDDLPDEAIAIARRCMIDGLGLFVAGVAEESVAILIEDAREQGGRSDALLLGAGEVKVPAALAARVLGTAGHAHDWDDTQISHDEAHVYGLLTHPTIPPLAAALAVSQALGSVPGRDFMTAFQAGFEVECKLSEWMLPNLYKRSFHSSGVVGIFGACIAAAKLMRLDAPTMRQAIGIASSMAAGLRVNFGTMTKPLHVGRAAENGLIAARLAARGYQADPSALDGPWGYCRAFADGVAEEKLSQGFGYRLTIIDPGVSIKPYPSGILTHQAMDAMRKLVVDHDIAPGDVAEVVFLAGSNILNPIRYPVAMDHLQAKFSMAALLSMIILRRRAGPSEFTNAFVLSREMQDMQRRVITKLDPGIEAMGTDIIRCRIELTTRDGVRLVGEANPNYRGGPSHPFTQDDLEAKFSVCTEGRLSGARGRQVLDTVADLEGMDDAGRLAALIQPETASVRREELSWQS